VIVDASKIPTRYSHASGDVVELGSRDEMQPTSARLISKEIESRMRRSKSFSRLEIPYTSPILDNLKAQQKYSHRARENNPYQEDLRRKIQEKTMKRSQSTPRISKNGLSAALKKDYHLKFPKMQLSTRVQEILKESEIRRRTEASNLKSSRSQIARPESSRGAVSQRSALNYNLNYKAPSRRTMTMSSNSISSIKSIQSKLSSI
jgi:hypothetical protein